MARVKSKINTYKGGYKVTPEEIFTEKTIGEIMEQLDQGNKVQIEVDKKNNVIKLFVVSVKRIQIRE